MYYDVNHPFAQQGWQCPVCGRVFAPWVWECPCGGNGRLTYTSDRTSPIDWTHHDSKTAEPRDSIMIIKDAGKPKW